MSGLQNGEENLWCMIGPEGWESQSLAWIVILMEKPFELSLLADLRCSSRTGSLRNQELKWAISNCEGLLQFLLQNRTLREGEDVTEDAQLAAGGIVQPGRRHKTQTQTPMFPSAGPTNTDSRSWMHKSPHESSKSTGRRVSHQGSKTLTVIFKEEK